MKTILKSAFVAGIMMTAVPSFGQLYIGLHLRVAPPPPRKEVVPARPPHRGWVWIGGHYDWQPRPHRYIWVRGHWVRPPRARAMWVAGRWEQRHGDWVFIEGRWEDEHPHEEHHRHDRH